MDVNKMNLISSWKVSESMVKPVSDGYDLSRSSRFIVGSNVETVAARLSNAFKKLSFIVTYDQNKAKAKCITRDFVKLHVCLHRGKGAYSHGIIVETVRRCGPRMDFLRESNILLDSAEGLKNVSNEILSGPHMRQPVHSLKCLRDAQELSDYPLSRETEALDRVERLLKDEREDAQVLGMEKLCSLLKSSESSASMNKRAGCAVLLGMNVPAIHEKLCSFLELGEECDNEDMEHMLLLRSLALRVIYLSCKIPVEKPCSDNVEVGIRHLLKMSSWLLDTMIPLLVRHARQGNSNDVLTAMKTLNLWASLSNDVKKKILECDGSSLCKAIKGEMSDCLVCEREKMLRALR